MTTVTPTPRAEGALAGTAYALAAQVCTAVFTAAVTLFLVRRLGPSGYGELALVLSVGGLVLVVADAAVAQSTARFAADRRQQVEALRDVVAAGLRLKLVLGGLAAVGLVALAGPLARAYGEPGMAWSLRLMVLAVVAESLFLLWLTLFQAVRRIALNVRLYLVESAAEAAAIVGLVLLGAGVSGAVLGRGIGYAVGAVAGAALVGRLLGQRVRLTGGRGTRREIAAYARPLFVNTGAYSAYSQVDVQLVGALLGRSAVGVYAAPLRLLTLLGYPGQAVASAVAPRMAGDEPDTRAFHTGLRCVLLYQTALVAPLLVWSRPIVDLVLGPGFAGSAPVLAALVPYVWLAGPSVLVSTTVNYLGMARRRIPVVLLALVLNTALCAVLVPLVGVVGGAVALSASYAVYVPLHVRLCRESFDLPLLPHALTVARSAAAGLVVAGLLGLIGTADLSAAQWSLGLALAPVAHLAVLVVTRELTAADLRQVRALLGRGRPSSAAAGTPSRAQQARNPAP